ncbi:DUF433 domain-containing protein [Halobellus marinus]|uniref:DUF433 domain-containing protein n=1 Tax=Halobellus TaxID=1073986 RepID=UPI0028A68F49|nr:DUF433 domain-containing protein [Halobellus sp. DFY28]
MCDRSARREPSESASPIGADERTEPHIRGGRLTVRFIHELVEEEDANPERVAEKYNVNIVDVYEALAYYHSTPAEMREDEQRHRAAVEEAERRTAGASY